MDAVTSGFCTNVNDCISDPGSSTLLHICLIHQANAHRIDKTIARITFIKRHFTGNRRNPHTVAVPADAGNDFIDQVLGSWTIDFAEV